MSTRTIVIGIIILALVGVGAWYVMQNKTEQQQEPQQEQRTQQDQVQGQDVTVGTGAEATPNSVVSVLYIGKLSDGTVFDSSEAHGNQPLVFTLGVDQLIPGFQIGVNGMKVGGERLLSIPASLGYGAQDVKDSSGKVVIPANSTLIFNVRLVDVKPASAPDTTATTTPTAAE